MCILKFIWANFDYVHWLFNKFSTCTISYLWDIHFECKDKYNSEWHILMEYEHIMILLQGNGGIKFIMIKKRYACQKKV